MPTAAEEARLRAIEQAAHDVLAAHEIIRLPVDLEAIARAERIDLLPGNYDNCFDGRIECRRNEGGTAFYLFYAEASPGLRTPGRVRFSIAHELGHFYLPDHRSFLLSGDWHGSHSDFVSDRPMEREADEFATCLLMPEQAFTAEVKRRTGRVCSLRELAGLAENVFNTSLTSTAIRYAKLCYEACSVVLSRDGRVLYSVPSEDMRIRGLGWIPRGTIVPHTAPTGRLFQAGADDHAQGEVAPEVWLNNRHRPQLWEEALRLGRTGLVLTLLAAQDDDEE